MGRIKKHDFSSEELIQCIKEAAIFSGSPSVGTLLEEDIPLEDIPVRIKQFQKIINRHHPKRRTMLYFVMYDIENDKVRRLVAKYLIKKGLTRIQKSIYVADTSRKVFDEIQETLRAVQEAYDNHDSIVMVPIAADDLRAMKIIGKNIDLDIVLGNENTLFF